MGCRSDDYNGVQAYRRMSEEVDSLTNMLCWTLTSLKNTDWLRPDIKDWWTKHQALDAARAAATAKQVSEAHERRVALAKLTPRELELLKGKV